MERLPDGDCVVRVSGFIRAGLLSYAQQRSATLVSIEAAHFLKSTKFVDCFSRRLWVLSQRKRG